MRRYGILVAILVIAVILIFVMVRRRSRSPQPIPPSPLQARFAATSAAADSCNNTAIGEGITCVLTVSAVSMTGAIDLPPFTSSGNLEIITVSSYSVVLGGCTVMDSKNGAPIPLIAQGNFSFGGAVVLRMWAIVNPMVGPSHIVSCQYTPPSYDDSIRMTVTFYQTPGSFMPDVQAGNAESRGISSITISPVTATHSPALIFGACANYSATPATMSNLTSFHGEGRAVDAPAIRLAQTTQMLAAAIGSTCTGIADSGLGIAGGIIAFSSPNMPHQPKALILGGDVF